MGIGSLLMLLFGLLIEGLPIINPTNWAYLIWMAIINTALGFTLWNITLRSLQAMESSIIANTMMILIALLAWIFLGEGLNAKQIAGGIMTGIGAMLVQVWLRVKPLDRNIRTV